jgi:ribosome-binding factor A
MKVSERSKKLAGVIEREISVIIHKLLTPDDIGFLTVTAVEVSGDLEVCDVFVKSFNGPVDYIKALQAKSKKMATMLAKQVKTRRVLKIRIKQDNSKDL